MKVDFIESWGSDLSTVNAARVSFANESSWEVTYEDDYDVESRTITHVPIQRLSERDAKLIHYLAKHKHTSCFEHQGATLRLKVPIFIARQIQRHRTFSYNEVSRRYVDTPPEFFWPDKWRKRADNVKQGSSDDEVTSLGLQGFREVTPQEAADKLVEHAMTLYNTMLEEKVAPELARMILPQNMYTEFYMTGNLRNWAHFLKLRLDGHAQKEVQEVANQVLGILQPLFPVSVEALMKHD